MHTREVAIVVARRNAGGLCVLDVLDDWLAPHVRHEECGRRAGLLEVRSRGNNGGDLPNSARVDGEASQRS